MPMYRCYYARSPAYVGLGSRATVESYTRSGAWPTGFPPPEERPHLFTIARLTKTHVMVDELEAVSLGAVFGLMQDEGRTADARVRFAYLVAEHNLTHFSQRVAFAESAAQGRTVLEIEPQSTASQELGRLVDELVALREREGLR